MPPQRPGGAVVSGHRGAMSVGPAVPVFDGHNDALTAAPAEELVAGRAGGHLDLPRARAGGLAGGIFAVFTPTPERRGYNAPARWWRNW